MKGKIKIIVIVLILILVSALGVLGMNTVKTYMSGAAGGGEPKGVLAKADARELRLAGTSRRDACHDDRQGCYCEEGQE